MCCTSSDLIIVLLPSTKRANARTSFQRLVRRRRVPKCQKAVKIESLDCPDRAPVLDVARDGTQTGSFQRYDRCRMQEWKVAETITQPEILYGRIGTDVLLLDEPCDRGALVTEFIDELE